jgi:putative oxidoreductase
MKWLVRLLEFGIAAVFIYAGVLKALDPVGFANDIENYHILPWPIGVRLAFYLPWLEIACGVGLLVRRATSGALAILGLLTFVFIVASVIAKARGIDVSCGCFGHAARNMSFAAHLAIDLALLAGIALAGWRELRLARGR